MATLPGGGPDRRLACADLRFGHAAGVALVNRAVHALLVANCEPAPKRDGSLANSSSDHTYGVIAVIALTYGEGSPV